MEPHEYELLCVLFYLLDTSTKGEESDYVLISRLPMRMVGQLDQKEDSKKPEGFKLKKFNVDMNNLKATCPAGKESTSARYQKDGRIIITFSRASCKECEFYQQCVGQSKANVRRLCVSPSYDYTLERRKEQETDTFKNEMRVRAQVEGTISEGIRFYGLRHAKYKGEVGHRFQFYMTGAALNVRRIIKAITQGR